MLTKRLIKNITLVNRYKKVAAHYLKDKAIDIRKFVPPAPRVINIFVTERCNLRCPMCLVGESRIDFLRLSRGRELDLDILKRTINTLKKYQPMYYLVGGEPLIYSSLFELIKHIKKNNHVVGLTTNGFLLKDRANDIFSVGLDYISCSLDGSTPEIHDKNRGVDGSFERLIKGIQFLKKLKGNKMFPNIKINTVITKDNINDLLNIFKVVKSLGADQFSLQHFSFYNEKIKKLNNKIAEENNLGSDVWGMKIDSKEYLNDDKINTLNENIKKLKVLCGRNKIEFLLAPRVSDLYEYYKGSFPSKESICKSPFSTISIRQSGDFELCQGYIVGNIYRDDLLECWTNKRAEYFRNYILKHKITPACYRCCALEYKFKQNA